MQNSANQAQETAKLTETSNMEIKVSGGKVTVIAITTKDANSRSHMPLIN